MSDSKKSPRRLQILPWAILLLGLVLTYDLQEAARESERRALQGEFDFRVDEIVGNIDTRLHDYEQVLAGAAGLFAASPAVSRGQFAAYVRALRLEGKYPGIQGVGFAELIPPRDKSRQIARIRAEGFPDYAIFPAGRRDIYTAIIYLEPFDWRNRRAFGYDMYSEPVRRAAMDLARDEDRTRISGKVRLLQETKQNPQAGFLMYLPVYRPGALHRTVAERRANLVGWVYAPFRMNDLMAGILRQGYGEIRAAMQLEIYDGDDLAAKRDPVGPMFDSNGRTGGADSAFHAVKQLSLFGHPWTVVVNSQPSFDARRDSDKAAFVAAAGTIGSLLLTWVVWLLVMGQARAEAMAERMTYELRQSETRQRKLNRALRLLSDCNGALVRAEDEYKLLVEICRLCVERGGYLMAWVGYPEQDEARHVRPMAQSGYESGYLDGIDVTWADTERGRGPTGTAIRTGATQINQNVLSNPSMAPWRQAAIDRGYRSSVALPLIGGDAKALGALTMYAREADAFDDEEIRLLEELAGDLAYGIASLRTRAAHELAKEKVAFLADFDALTRLPNRLLLRDRFERAVVAATREQSEIAMLYLDLDNFQRINDSLGHELGDKVLVAAAQRLRQALPPTETISRLGGDEFVILLSGLRDAPGVVGVADAIGAAFAEPVNIDGHMLNLSFSIGISLFPGDGEDFDTLLKCADIAVNNAKESGRNTYRFFTRAMNAQLLEQMKLTAGLQGALTNREFVLHYQPQVDIRSGRIIGAEALIRWQHAQDGLVPPGVFIPLAEQSGHIVPIGAWVLDEACRQAKAWQDRGWPPLVVAVNLSALQFKHGDVLELVAATLAATGLPPDRLELELTESILLQDVEATVKTLHGLKSLGVKLSIDDFGTGYSSLSYLKRLAVDKLKIDQSFVRDMLSDGDGAAIVKAIIQLGHILQLEVIAEGVETDEQLAFLDASGCDEVQGYLFSRPVPAERFAQLMEKDSHP